MACTGDALETFHRLRSCRCQDPTRLRHPSPIPRQTANGLSFSLSHTHTCTHAQLPSQCNPPSGPVANATMKLLGGSR
uniref:Uncharacterized protein n=1 Tax=Arundo donax TaxID=35708 RepID=A0A0A9DV74_ARUDO